MDAKEILNMMEALSVQRGINKESVAVALEDSIAAAVSKQLHLANEEEEVGIRVNINRNTGDFKIIKLTLKDGIELGEYDYINELSDDMLNMEELPDVVFDRVSIQAAKQLILQKVKEAERHQLVEDYRPRLNKMVSGVVKRITRAKDIIVLLSDRIEAILPYDSTLPNDDYQPEDEVSAILEDIDPIKSTHQLFLSRTNDNMVSELFVQEVPEIAQQIVEICSIARLPGIRSKVAVRPKDRRIDAMSACIGIQGKRVQGVQKELQGEKIDILEWDDDPEQLVKNVLANANITSVNINPDTHTIDVAVPSEYVGEILGKNGQNIRLATQLIGWEINIMKEEEALEKRSKTLDELRNSFMEILDAEDVIASDLVKGGFSSVKQIAYAPTEKFLRIEGFDEDLASEIRNRAREYLLSYALDDNLDGGTGKGKEHLRELMQLENMTIELAQSLTSQKISTISELAEHSIDELEEVIPDIDGKQAAKIILEARRFSANV